MLKTKCCPLCSNLQIRNISLITINYVWNEPEIGNKTLWKLLNGCGCAAMIFRWKWYTPHDTPLPPIFIKTYYLLWKWKCMFISPCKLLKSMALPLLTGTWTSKPLELSKVTLGLTSGFNSSLTPPSLVDGLGLSLMTFSTSPSVLDFLTTPSELLTVALGFLFFQTFPP